VTDRRGVIDPVRGNRTFRRPGENSRTCAIPKRKGHGSLLYLSVQPPAEQKCNVGTTTCSPTEGRAEGAECRDCNKGSRISCPSAGEASTRLRVACSGCFALDWQAREVSKRTGMLVDTVDENVSENLPEEYKTCVYRIVQEALNNCSKHAYAKNVRVVVRQEPNHLRVSIEDDGKGFDASRVRGLGLVGMNERVSQVGGVLKVESDPARGPRLRVDLPLPNASADSEELSGFVNYGYQSAMRKETLASLPQLGLGFLKTKAARKTERLPVLSACYKFFGDTWFPFVTAAVIIIV
jgi:hypothetical protein